MGHPNDGAKQRWDRLKSVIFDLNLAISQKRYTIGTER